VVFSFQDGGFGVPAFVKQENVCPKVVSEIYVSLHAKLLRKLSTAVPTRVRLEWSFPLAVSTGGLDRKWRGRAGIVLDARLGSGMGNHVTPFVCCQDALLKLQRGGVDIDKVQIDGEKVKIDGFQSDAYSLGVIASKLDTFLSDPKDGIVKSLVERNKGILLRARPNICRS